LTIEFEDALKGKEVEINVPRTEKCSICDGSGVEPGYQPKICPVCNGTGQVTQSHSFIHISTTCYKCGGTGKININPCKKCRGSGLIKIERKISVKIPPGVEDGTRLKIAGEGEAGRMGGENGDLYIFINVKKHKFFERQGNDLYCEVFITIPEAVLGTEIEIPTFDGKKVNVVIPPGTQPGKILRLKGLGAPDVHGYGKGDLMVKVNE
jgi:molecular chaperone DnaJ